MAGFFLMFILALLIEFTGAFPRDQIYLNIEILFEFAMALQGVAFFHRLGLARRIPRPVILILSGLGLIISFMRTILTAMGVIEYFIIMRTSIRSFRK